MFKLQEHLQVCDVQDLANLTKASNTFKNKFVNLVLFFFGMIYFENVLRAILFLSPFDTALIQSLPDFDSINICVGKNGHRTTPFKKDSLSTKLSENIFHVRQF